MLESWVLNWFVILNLTTLALGGLGLLIGSIRQS